MIINVQDLIDKLQNIEDKTTVIHINVKGNEYELFEVYEDTEAGKLVIQVLDKYYEQ